MSTQKLRELIEDKRKITGGQSFTLDALEEAADLIDDLEEKVGESKEGGTDGGAEWKHDRDTTTGALRDIIDVPWQCTSEEGNRSTYACGTLGRLEYRVTCADHGACEAEAMVGGEVVAHVGTYGWPEDAVRHLLHLNGDLIRELAGTIDPSKATPLVGEGPHEATECDETDWYSPDTEPEHCEVIEAEIDHCKLPDVVVGKYEDRGLVEVAGFKIQYIDVVRWRPTDFGVEGRDR